MLKANFKITETGGTGVVQLQALLNSTIGWVNVGTTITLTNGHKTVDDVTDIEIDTAIFSEGMSYRFRLIDMAGVPVSNDVFCTIPNSAGGGGNTGGGSSARLTYATAKSEIQFTNTGGDNWGANLFLPNHNGSSQIEPAVSVDYYQAKISFYQNGVKTVILDDEDTSTKRQADVNLPITGMGAGTYLLGCLYTLMDGRQFTTGKIVKVNAIGSILAALSANGMTVIPGTGGQLTATAAQYQTGTAYPIKWRTLDVNGNIADIGSGETINLTATADSKLLLYNYEMDSVITDDLSDELNIFMTLHYS